MPIDINQNIQKKFGAHLQKIRLEKGLSLRALAANCNLDDSNISKIEQGKVNIQLTTLFELAKGLDLKPEELINIDF